MKTNILRDNFRKGGKQRLVVCLVIHNLAAVCAVVTWYCVLAVVFVQLHQDRRGHHQKISEGRGDRMGNHREALTQTTQTLAKIIQIYMKVLEVWCKKLQLHFIQSDNTSC